MKIAIDIADAVAAELSGMSLEVHRRVLPDYELAELKFTTATVVPKSVQIANVTRDATHYEVAIDIGIQRKIGKDTDAEVESLSGVVSAIVAFLNRRPLSGLPNARFTTIANEPVYAPEMLSDNRLFLSVVTVTYTVME